MADDEKDGNTAVVDSTPSQDPSPEKDEQVIDQPATPEPEPEPARGPTGWIPKERFQEVIDQRREKEAELEREREQRIRLEEQLKAKAEPSTPAKTYSRAELEKLVEDGRLTRSDADAYMDDLIEQRAVQKATKLLETKLSESRKFEAIQGRLNAYVDVLPGLRQPGSAEFKKAASEYAFLVELDGQPANDVQKRAMELKAVRAAFGDLDSLKARRAATMPNPEREATMETHTSTNRPSAQQPKDPIKDLTPAQKAHYEKMFQKTNDYPNGWEDVRKELQWQRPSLARRTR